MTKIRADLLLSESYPEISREKAKRLIMGGEVFLGSLRIDKPGQLLDDKDKLTVKPNSLKYVSRGGFKLEKAIDLYKIDLKNKICVDIGASTGGFTHCMLINGAKKVYAIDVGYNQLSYQLQVDDRVISMEKTNIRNFDVKTISDSIDFVSIDVSFISLELVLPKAFELVRDGGKIVALIKPQFEAGREKVGKKGIVKDKSVHKEVIEKIVRLSKSLGLRILGITYSPIKGTKGNVEFLIYLEKSEKEDAPYSTDDLLEFN
ncbi:TlyA family RNA methyltransferase [Peptoniphilus catoniae]|uniref:TlyA family RNA methyltransferase n=1 Tax=Peptoniphilus catoniae TaxID=1660341 RepID=UPI0010FE8633|nr:TlyA family RNA methyltransferase [Peptoniphilus catoniae]